MTHQPIRSLELLAPARDAATGIEAIRHGADAVYIGGPGFGARAAAGNSIDDIRHLCTYAHIFDARVYVTLNTILYDDELPQAEKMVWALYEAGVDALIVQDLALLRLNLPPIALHASTQMDNCTPEKAQWLEAIGFRQIVIARETDMSTTHAIAASVKVPIEAFVHGALCVSYSGRCYASQHCFQRSANRGACAQFCRLAFDLIDADGNVVVNEKHLLSLRDMNRSAVVEEMADAGIQSFKIEGRLKSVDYVKNVTAHYRRIIDHLIASRPADFRRASFGASTLTFEPDAARSFNRGFTTYFWHGRTSQPIHSFHSPKAMGTEIGSVVRADRRSFTLSRLAKGASPVVAGDGLCFVDTEGRLQGFRVNRVEGADVIPAKMPRLQRGTVIFRNADFAFERLLAKPSAERRLKLEAHLRLTADGFAIDLADESGRCITLHKVHPHEPAKTPQEAAQTAQLSRLGDTPFLPAKVSVSKEAAACFLPASVLGEWRREAVDLLLSNHQMTYVRDVPGKVNKERAAKLCPDTSTYTANVANREAKAFYEEIGAATVAPAFECTTHHSGDVIMTCRHCLRHALGICPKQGKRTSATPREPLSLRLPDGRTFPLRFDCKRCEMQVLAN